MGGCTSKEPPLTPIYKNNNGTFGLSYLDRDKTKTKLDAEDKKQKNRLLSRRQQDKKNFDDKNDVKDHKHDTTSSLRTPSSLRRTRKATGASGIAEVEQPTFCIQYAEDLEPVEPAVATHTGSKSSTSKTSSTAKAKKGSSLRDSVDSKASSRDRQSTSGKDRASKKQTSPRVDSQIYEDHNGEMYTYDIFGKKVYLGDNDETTTEKQATDDALSPRRSRTFITDQEGRVSKRATNDYQSDRTSKRATKSHDYADEFDQYYKARTEENTKYNQQSHHYDTDDKRDTKQRSYLGNLHDYEEDDATNGVEGQGHSSESMYDRDLRKRRKKQNMMTKLRGKSEYSDQRSSSRVGDNDMEGYLNGSHGYRQRSRPDSGTSNSTYEGGYSREGTYTLNNNNGYAEDQPATIDVMLNSGGSGAYAGSYGNGATQSSSPRGYANQTNSPRGYASTRSSTRKRPEYSQHGTSGYDRRQEDDDDDEKTDKFNDWYGMKPYSVTNSRNSRDSYGTVGRTSNTNDTNYSGQKTRDSYGSSGRGTNTSANERQYEQKANYDKYARKGYSENTASDSRATLPTLSKRQRSRSDINRNPQSATRY